MNEPMPEVHASGAPHALREARPGEGAFPALPVTRRPDPALLKYYALTSLAAGPFFVLILLPLYFKYHSLRYVVEEEGITMRWGVLFRKEISLTFSRIQDIHLSSNFVERWLGLARIQVQTASGSSSAEMTIEGLKEFDGVRDFLYARMRGARDQGFRSPTDELPAAPDHSMQALTETLREVAAEVRALRAAVAERQGEAPRG